MALEEARVHEADVAAGESSSTRLGCYPSGWLDSTICGTIQNPERTSEIWVLLVLLVEFPGATPVFFQKKSPRVVEENFEWSTTREFAFCPRHTRAFLDRGGVCNVFCRCN